MTTDQAIAELRAVRADMRGINPIVSTYKKLKERETYLLTFTNGDIEIPKAVDEKILSFVDMKPDGVCVVEDCRNQASRYFKGQALARTSKLWGKCGHHQKRSLKKKKV